MILYHGSYLEIQTPIYYTPKKTLISDVAFIQHHFMNRQQSGVKNLSGVAKVELFPVTTLMSRLIRNSKF